MSELPFAKRSGPQIMTNGTGGTPSEADDPRCAAANCREEGAKPCEGSMNYDLLDRTGGNGGRLSGAAGQLRCFSQSIASSQQAASTNMAQTRVLSQPIPAPTHLNGAQLGGVAHGAQALDEGPPRRFWRLRAIQTGHSPCNLGEDISRLPPRWRAAGWRRTWSAGTR